MEGKVFGIDFGTNSIKIFKKNEGVVVNEKNVIAIANRKNIIAVGNEAYDMLEKAPQNIEVNFPVIDGVIADIHNMKNLLNELLKKLNSTKRSIGKASFLIAVPTDITDVEKRAFSDLVANAYTKAKNIKIVEKPIADALGVGIDVNSPKGNMVVDIGADTTEISIISLGGIVLSKLVKIGGNNLDESIKVCMRKKYNLIVGDKTAEFIKKELSSAYLDKVNTTKVYGRNIVTGLPIEMEVSAEDVHESIKEHLHSIVDSIKIILERTPPELSADIIDMGIFLTGGSARIKDLDKLIKDETELEVNLCKDYAMSAVNGLGKVIEQAEFSSLASTFKQIIYN